MDGRSYAPTDGRSGAPDAPASAQDDRALGNAHPGRSQAPPLGADVRPEEEMEHQREEDSSKLRAFEKARLDGDQENVIRLSDRRTERSLCKLLPLGFFTLPHTAQVPIIERLFSEVGPERWLGFENVERKKITDLLEGIAEAFPGERAGEQARRISESVPVASRDVDLSPIGERRHKAGPAPARLNRRQSEKLMFKLCGPKSPSRRPGWP
jgi:hypothetical protein